MNEEAFANEKDGEKVAQRRHSLLGMETHSELREAPGGSAHGFLVSLAWGEYHDHKRALLHTTVDRKQRQRAAY